MDRANLTQPLFESDRSGDTFTIRLLAHHLLSPDDWKWLERFKDCNLSDDDARALIVAREIGAIDNAAYRSIIHVDTLTASGNLRRLRDSGLLEQKGLGRATYYVPTKKLRGEGAIISAKAQVGGLNPTAYAQMVGLGSLPEGLTDAILGLKGRNPPEKLRDVIYELCSWKPIKASHLAGLLGKRHGYLVEKHLRPMLEAGELEHLYPENLAHPKQAYRAVPGTREVATNYTNQPPKGEQG